MKFKNNINDQFNTYCNQINLHSKNFSNINLKKSIELIKKVKKKKSKIILFGNGGSSSIANHVAIDFCKVANIKAITFNESNLITCFSNDYGYENWMKKSLEFHLNSDDLVIFISSSGRSKNHVIAANFCKKKRVKFITLTGFSKSNPLKKLGDVNFWVNSKNYNHIEMAHHIILVFLADHFGLN